MDGSGEGMGTFWASKQILRGPFKRQEGTLIELLPGCTLRSKIFKNKKVDLKVKYNASTKL